MTMISQRWPCRPRYLWEQPCPCGHPSLPTDPEQLCGYCRLERYGVSFPCEEEWWWERVRGIQIGPGDEFPYYADWFGVRIAERPGDDQPVIWRPDEDFGVAVRIWRVFYKNNPAYAEITWTAKTGFQKAIRGLENIARKGDIEHAITCFDAIDGGLNFGRRGRPRLEDESDIDIRIIVDEANEYKRKNPRLTWDIIAEYHLGISSRTLRRYRERTASWPR